MNQLSIEDAAYIAGILDGEGSISLGRTKDGKRYTPSVTIVNGKVALMRYLVETTGLGHVIRRDRQDLPNARISYQWQLRLDEVIPFLSQVTPHLRLKQQQATLLMAYMAARSQKPANWSEYRAWIRRSLLVLNSRGRDAA